MASCGIILAMLATLLTIFFINKVSNLKCHKMVVMPNNFHCIIEIVGANLCVRPNLIKH